MFLSEFATFEQKNFDNEGLFTGEKLLVVALMEELYTVSFEAKDFEYRE